MLQRFIKLEFKSFFRSSALAANIVMKIFQIIGILYMLAMFVFLAFGAYYITKKELHTDPLPFISRFMVYWLTFDLLVRYFFQQMPTQNIKPFLTMNIRKSTLVNYLIAKTIGSFFTWGNLFIYIPFLGILLYNGHSVSGSIAWVFALILFGLCNNFINILLNGKDWVAWLIAGVVAITGGLDYYGIISLSQLSGKVMMLFYHHWWLIVVPILLLVAGFAVTKQFIKKNFYLDRGLEMKKEVARTENIRFLDKYGVLGTFINNDIKMLRRNKMTKSILFGSIMFTFYGLLMFTSPVYKTPYMMMFMGLFVTGGFQFLFGQRVPAFDSSYYPLMMTLNVPYKEYLKAKWWLMIIVTAVSMILALFYAFIGWEIYVTFFAAGLYNIGVNSQFTLWSGAYNKTQIDLNSKEKRMGQKNSFNLKALLLLIPKLLLPMAVFGITKYFYGMTAAVISIAILGMIGFFLREKIFDIIVKQYKREKYSTIEAFKNKD